MSKPMRLSKRRGMYRWYSLCSRHGGTFDSECAACKAGEWRFIPTTWMNALAFWTLKPLWLWWNNRTTSHAKKFLRSQFPKLR